MRNSRGNVFARRFTTSERKVINTGMGVVSMVNPVGMVAGLAFEGGKAFSGQDNTVGINTAGAASEGFSGFTAAASKDAQIVMEGAEGTQGMFQSASKLGKAASGVLDGIGVVSEALSGPTSQEQLEGLTLEGLTFELFDDAGVATINIANEGLLEFGNENLSVGTVAKNLNRTFNVLSNELKGFDLTTNEGFNAARQPVRDNLKDIRKTISETDLDDF